jgi:hypothetical protein
MALRRFSGRRVGRFVYSSQFTGVIRSALWALLTDEVIAGSTRFATILTQNVAESGQVRCRHGLHTNGRIQECKVVLHIFHGLLAERARVG